MVEFTIPRAFVNGGKPVESYVDAVLLHAVCALCQGKNQIVDSVIMEIFSELTGDERVFLDIKAASECHRITNAEKWDKSFSWFKRPCIEFIIHTTQLTSQSQESMYL